MAIDFARSAASALPAAASAGAQFLSDGSVAPDWSSIGKAVLAMLAPSLPREAQIAVQQIGNIAGAAASPFMAAWNAPQSIGALFTALNGGDEHDSGDALRRRAQRGKDIGATQKEFISPFADPSKSFEDILASPVENSNVGDTIANILKFVNNGTWYTDTSHGWRPDPALMPFQAKLADRGYTGATEPKRGDMGGVGELTMGGGLSFMNPELRQKARDSFSALRGYAPPDDTPDFELQNSYNILAGEGAEPINVTGPHAWNMFMRKIAGVPEGTRDPWDFDKPIKYVADSMSSEGGQIPVPSPAFDYNRFINAPTGGPVQTDPENQYGQYLESLPWEVNQKLRNYERNRPEYTGYNTGG